MCCSGSPRALATAESVAQGADGSFVLAIPDAKIVGKSIHFEDEYVGYWNDAKDYVEWKILVKTPELVA